MPHNSDTRFTSTGRISSHNLYGVASKLNEKGKRKWYVYTDLVFVRVTVGFPLPRYFNTWQEAFTEAIQLAKAAKETTQQ